MRPVRRTALALVLSAASLFTVVASAGPAAAEEVVLETVLTGEAEAPGPGDPNGIGEARITMRPPKGYLCFQIRVKRIQLPAIGAHIHQAPAGEPGPVVVTLGAPDESGVARGCLSGLSSELLRHIALRPEEFYVNVHTHQYPAGAVRGQLG